MTATDDNDIIGSKSEVSKVYGLRIRGNTRRSWMVHLVLSATVANARLR